VEPLQENLTVAYQDTCHRHRARRARLVTAHPWCLTQGASAIERSSRRLGMLPTVEALDASVRNTPARSLLPRSSV
jgi:hypothetical protein